MELIYGFAGIALLIMVATACFIFVPDWLDHRPTFIDSIEEKTDLIDPDGGKRMGIVVLYKRTYSNGTIKYVRKKYTN